MEANEKVVTAIQKVIEDSTDTSVNMKTKIQQVILVRNEAVDKVLREVYEKRNKRDSTTTLAEFKQGSDIFKNITDISLSGVDSQEDGTLEEKLNELENEISTLKDTNVGINAVCDNYKSEIAKLKEINGKLSGQVNDLKLETIPSGNVDSNLGGVADTIKSYTARLDPNTPKFHGKSEEDVEEWFDKVEVNLEVAKLTKTEWLRRMNG
jgi:hypothetical protein